MTFLVFFFFLWWMYWYHSYPMNNEYILGIELQLAQKKKKKQIKFIVID